MFILNTWPDAVMGSGSRASHTQPVPSIAACWPGSVSTAKTRAADTSIVALALTISAFMMLRPY